MIRRYLCQIVIVFVLGILTVKGVSMGNEIYQAEAAGLQTTFYLSKSGRVQPELHRVNSGVLLAAIALFALVALALTWLHQEKTLLVRLRQALLLFLAFAAGVARMYAATDEMECRLAGISDGEPVSVQGRIIKKQRKQPSSEAKPQNRAAGQMNSSGGRQAAVRKIISSKCNVPARESGQDGHQISVQDASQRKRQTSGQNAISIKRQISNRNAIQTKYQISSQNASQRKRQTSEQNAIPIKSQISGQNAIPIKSQISEQNAIQTKRHNLMQTSILNEYKNAYGMIYQFHRICPSIFVKKQIPNIPRVSLENIDKLIPSIRQVSFVDNQPAQQWVLYLEDCYLKTSQGIRPAGKVILYVDDVEPVVGNTVTVSGNIKLFSRARNEGNFDACAYYQNQGYTLSVYAEDGTYQVADRSRRRIRGWLYDIQQQFLHVYESRMPEEEAGVLCAMILGEKSLLAGETKELYRQGGIAHILAISGLHISILGMAGYRMLRKRGCSFAVSSIISISLLALFGIMAGMGISTVRAIVMFGIYLGAECCGRAYDSMNALAVAAGALLLYNPCVLFLAGFQFSFAAVAGVLFGREMCAAFRPAFRLTETVYMSLGIQMLTLPLTAWYYFEIPVYSVLLNMLVLPFMAFVLLSGLLGGGLGIVACVAATSENLFLPAGRICGQLSQWALAACTMLLRYFSSASSYFLQFPGAICVVGRPRVWSMAGYYLILAVCSLVVYKKAGKVEENSSSCAAVDVSCLDLHRKVQKVGKNQSIQLFANVNPLAFYAKAVNNSVEIPLIAACLSCMLLLFFPYPKPAEVSVLDVGQGDGIYIHTSDGLDIMIDGGSSDVKQAGTYRILPFLKAKGVAEIDYWFVSHLDEDHISGLRELVQGGYPIGQVVFAKGVVRDEAYEGLAGILAKQQVAVRYMDKGDMLRSANACVTCLAPQYGGQGSDRNGSSLVLLYEDRGFRGFFSGDISNQEEARLAAGGAVPTVSLYKAAHHGSSYSNCDQLLERLLPDICVVSCAEKNRYGHPGKEAVANMERNSGRVCYTMHAGRIRVRW